MIKFLQKLKLWQKITLSILFLGVLYVVIVPLAFCSNIDLNLSKQQQYISCTKDSDCISKSCGCLNSEGVKKFSTISIFCGMDLLCIPPSECKCEEGKCSGSFDDHIVGQPCFDQSGCPDDFMCYKPSPEYKIVDCNEVECECYKYCNSDNDCPKSMSTCSPIQIRDYVGICVK